jgi:hypothetical protein
VHKLWRTHICCGRTRKQIEPEKFSKGHSWTDATFVSDTIPPIAGLPSTVSQRTDRDPVSKLLIDKAEGKLPERVFSEVHEVDRPALRSFSDFFYFLTEEAFEIDGRCATRRRVKRPSLRRPWFPCLAKAARHGAPSVGVASGWVARPV